MKLMTFNIDTGGDDIDTVKKVIREAKPDFLALQEANNFEKNNYRLLKEVSRDTGLPYYAFAPAPALKNWDGRAYHVVSLSRSPIKQQYTLSGPPFQNAILSTVIDSPLGELAICNVQLQVFGEDKRLKEIEIILEREARRKNRILMGDLNSLSPDDDYDPETLEVEHRFDVITRIKRYYVDAAVRAGLVDRSTFPTPSNRNPAYTKPIRIDYVFVAPPLARYIKDATVIRTRAAEEAGDHSPFEITLTV